MRNDPVQVGVCGPVDLKVFLAELVNGLIVHEEGHVGQLEAGVSGQNGVVRLNNGRGHLRGWVNDKLEFGLFGVFGDQTVHQE